jgi:hypothetical protein
MKVIKFISYSIMSYLIFTLIEIIAIEYNYNQLLLDLIKRSYGFSIGILLYHYLIRKE